MRTEQFKRKLVKKAVNAEPAELVGAQEPIDDAEASFDILRLSALSRLSHLLWAILPFIIQEASRSFDAPDFPPLGTLALCSTSSPLRLSPRVRSKNVLVGAGAPVVATLNMPRN